MNYNDIISLVYETRKLVFDPSLRADTREKARNDYVTAVDEGISNFLKTELAALFPDIGFVTEEEKDHKYNDRYFILDPIDGTTNLVHDYRMSTVSLALCENGEITFGAVFNPYSKELFFSVKGRGAHTFDTTFGIKRLLSIGVERYTKGTLHVSTLPDSKCIIEFGAGSTHKENADVNFELAKRMFCNFGDIRRICSTAMTICNIAAGRMDGYFEKVIKPWDFAAGSLILTEAGGVITDFNGETLPFDRPTTIVASNGAIHGKLLDIINGSY